MVTRNKTVAQSPQHPLVTVFEAALHQATQGKGTRHGGESKPFFEQKWLQLAKVHGNGFLTGQAEKKIAECVESGNLENDIDAFNREILGAIVYLGMAYLHANDLTD